MSDFSYETEVRWGDMDAFQHVSNVVYLRYIEDCRARWFMEVVRDWQDDDSGPVVANININYRRPVTWPQRLRLSLNTHPPGRSSLKVEVRITSTDDEDPTLFADSVATMVWVDRKTGEPVPLPTALRKAVE